MTPMVTQSAAELKLLIGLQYGLLILVSVVVLLFIFSYTRRTNGSTRSSGLKRSRSQRWSPPPEVREQWRRQAELEPGRDFQYCTDPSGSMNTPFDEDLDDDDERPRYDTGMRSRTRNGGHMVKVISLDFLLGSTVYNFTVHPMYLGMDALPDDKPSVFQDMIARLRAKGCRPVTLAMAYGNLAAALSKLGFHKEALAATKEALHVFEDGCAPADVGCGEAAAMCIEDLAAIEYPGATEELRSCDTLRRIKHQVFRRDILGELIRSHEAARILALAPEALDLVTEAWQAQQAEQFDDALSPLRRVTDLLEDKLAGSHIYWPLAALYHDLGLVKLRVQGFQYEAFGDIAESWRLARMGDAPEPVWRNYIESAADVLLESK